MAHAVIAQDELIEAGLLQDLEQRTVDIRMHFHVVDALGDDRQQLGDRMRRQRIAELILQGDGQIGVLIEQPVQFHLKVDRCIIEVMYAAAGIFHSLLQRILEFAQRFFQLLLCQQGVDRTRL